ncbi:AAA family ATPase [Amphritea opalescens]|uniref:AAA family ATPase n=1 Tax=Amphritea opalescens TaxID=2490544 RepID=A0A430KW82_9GAMM|nr:AAA family ATPase [Amphritea opalescens]RTE67761.1 AAA family ATPase [Amphritea opalescens]
MRKILLGAKVFALQESASRIAISHIQQSLTALKPADDVAFAKVCELVDIVTPHEKSELFSSQLLEQIASKERVSYAPEVQALIAELKAAGISFESTVSDLYISIRKGLYKSVVASLAEMKELLTSQIFDQDEAVEAVSDAVMKMSWAEKTNRPRAIFSFLGPPATGKTYMAEILSLGLQGYKVKSFDMTQLNSEKEGFALVGLRKGFESAGEGQLTQFVKDHPKSIIIFDEIEKSHTRVQTSLLRMLSAGYLKDEYSGDEIDFRETIIVFTSNLGSSLYSNRTFTSQTASSPHQARETLLQVIRKETKIESGNTVAAIPPELLSRLAQGSVVLFKKLSLSGLSKIATQLLIDDSQSFESKLGLAVQFKRLETLVPLLVLRFAPNFDTREMKSRIGDFAFDPITDYLLQHPDINVERVVISLSESAEAFLAELDFIHLPNQLATKHQRVFFDFEISETDGVLLLQYTQARIEKLAKEDDFTDASGIQVDLPDVSFEQIAGHHKIKARLNEVIHLLKEREYLSQQGVQPPKGMLLYGVPGTGKTLLAKAFAHQADLPFLSCSGNDLLNEDFIRKLFARAREYAPSVIFIDEIDALPKRGSAGPHADALVNRMLVEIDGFSGNEDDVFIIAATNRKELIDSAILRSGRIDLHYEVPQLDKDARSWFIRKMLAKDIFDSNIDIDQVLLLTAGFSGADLQKVSRETILFALREGIQKIDQQCLLEQINTLKYGQPLNLENSRQHLKETAYHEAAHAVISHILLPERRIEQITVVARANFLGMVSYDNEQSHDYTRAFLFNMSCVALAGREAQFKKFNDQGLDSGAAGDLKQAMHYAWLAIGCWGMDESLYNLNVEALRGYTGHPSYQDKVDERVSCWIDEATANTRDLVSQHWHKIEAVAEAVLDEEVLDQTTFCKLMESF